MKSPVVSQDDNIQLQQDKILKLLQLNLLCFKNKVSIKIGSGQSHSLCYGGTIGVNGYFRNSQTRKERRTAEFSYNHVDRVRLEQNSIYNHKGPDRGSGWRQKSISHLDLATTKQTITKSNHQYNNQHYRLRPSRSLDSSNNLDFHEYYTRIEPEKDYDDYNSNGYDDQIYNENSQQFEFSNESCSLRRTRSLAVIREETFNDIQLNSIKSSTRSQLIPRAKLVNRSLGRERSNHNKQQIHSHQHKNHRREFIDVDSAGSGIDTSLTSDVNTITRESDDYYTNLKRLEAVKVQPSTTSTLWQQQNDKSDLESINSDYFKNSLHQNNTNYHSNDRLHHHHHHQYISCNNSRRLGSKSIASNTSIGGTVNGKKYHLEIEINNENSQSSAFPETTTSNSEDQTDSCSNTDELEIEERISRISEKTLKNSEDLYVEINLRQEEETDFDQINEITQSEEDNKEGTLKKQESASKTFIAYDSVYLSSEESSSEETVIEEIKTSSVNEIVEPSSILRISIEDNYTEPQSKIEPQTIPIVKQKPLESIDQLYSQVRKIDSSTITTKPKILSAVEKKLKRFSDYATVTKRGVLEHLTYISTSSKVLKTNDIHIIDTVRPNLIDNQYYSLPDINIGQSLKVSERIDAKLRSSYNINNNRECDKSQYQQANYYHISDLLYNNSNYNHLEEYRTYQDINNSTTSTVTSTEIYDSIKRFGRAHKRARQREYTETEDISVSTTSKTELLILPAPPPPPPPPSIDENLSVLSEDCEKLREVPCIEIETSVCKDFEEFVEESFESNTQNDETLLIECANLENNNKIDKFKSQFNLNEKTDNFPGGQFHIIVTDTENNVIEEDSIESVIILNENYTENEENFNEIDIKYQCNEFKSIDTNYKYKEIEKNHIFTIEKPKNNLSLNNNNTEISQEFTDLSKVKPKIKILNKIEKSNKEITNKLDIFKAHPVQVYTNDIVNKIKDKMSRPQILHVIDSKKQCQDIQKDDIDNKTVIKNVKAEKEFLEKVDSVRCYWSKLIQDEKTLNNDNNQNKINENQEENLMKNVKRIESLQSNENYIQENSIKRSSTSIDLKKFSPTIEVVELNGEKQATLVKAHNIENSDFDHVRYKVMKSNLFRNNILTRSKKEAQFDGLIQYLQDYSFQELLTNNNVVIIEPVRTKIEKPSKDSNKSHKINCKITGGSMDKDTPTNVKGIQTKHHFFYHPVRVNRELLEEELPNPDTVRNVRKFFEEYIPKVKNRNSDVNVNQCKLYKNDIENNEENEKIDSNFSGGSVNNKRHLRYLTIDTSYGSNSNNNNCNIRKWDSASLSSGISSGDLSSPCECNELLHQEGRVRVKDEIDNYNHHNQHQHHQHINQNNNEINYVHGIYNSSEDNLCEQNGEGNGDDDIDETCESYYVSEDVLEKIRECGSTVTYYGGRILNNRSPELNCTAKAIIDEIHGKEYLTCNACQPNCCPDDRELREKFRKPKQMDIQFKLVKSNSCSSRLELIGTDKNIPLNGNSDEPGVKELVNRLESGAINNTTVPRIIESQCIEKTGRTTNGTEILTINNQLIDDASVKDVSNTIALVDMIKQVTVNNHITVGPLKKSVIKNVDGQILAKGQNLSNQNIAEESEKKINNKICRNRNVDLAFTMTKGSIKDSTNDIVIINKKIENTENLSSIGQKFLIAVEDKNNNKNIHKKIYPLGSNNNEKENPTSIKKKTDDCTIFEEAIIKRNGNMEQNCLVNKFNNNTDIKDTNDDNTHSDRIFKTTVAMGSYKGLQQTRTNKVSHNKDKNTYRTGELNDVRTSSSRSSNSDGSLNGGSIILDHSIVKHYVANDKNIIERRKYDDIEFEEFEVYDPTKMIMDENKSSNGNSVGYDHSNGKSDDCYDSLDDKL